MKSLQNEDMGKLILRVTVAVLMLFHGIGKLQGGIDFLIHVTESNGLPGFYTYGVYIGEVIAPIMLIVGYCTTAAAALIIFTMLNAIFMMHTGDIFSVTMTGAWGIELQAFYILSSVAIIFLGSGKYTYKMLKK